MSLYINIITQEQRQFDDTWFNECVSTANPKIENWVLMPPKPNYDPTTETVVWENNNWVIKPLPTPSPYRVSKDTIVSRISESNKLPDLINLISSLPDEQKFLWDNFAWFWSNNQTIINMATQISLDPVVILARDPYL